MLDSAVRVEQGIPLNPELDQALIHGSSIGGARPKALVQEQNKKYVAKFSSTSDVVNVVKAEFVAMRLAAMIRLNVANVNLLKTANKDVLLIERFDRLATKTGWQRKAMVSALTLLALDEMTTRYASYQHLAEIIRHRFSEPKATLKELFSRLVFNILSGNTDDHARNHAAFWNGKTLSLTPAYDLCPQSRTGNEASQAMLIAGHNNLSQLKTCLQIHQDFLLTKSEAIDIFDHRIATIKTNWQHVCEEAQLSEVEKNYFWRRQFLNDYSLVR